MTFNDTYVRSSDKELLKSFAANFINTTPIGENEGEFYVCIRATFDVTPLVAQPLFVVAPEVGSEVAGVFA